MTLAYWFVLIGFLFATAFAVLKARDITQWTKTQSQLVHEVQRLNGGKPIPDDITLMKTKAVFGRYSWPEAVLVGGFIFSGGAAVFNAFRVLVA